MDDELTGFAQVAQALFLENRENFTENALRLLHYGGTDIREQLKEEIIDDFQGQLVAEVENEGLVAAPYRMVFRPERGVYHRIRRHLRASDVPDMYLDVEALIPDLDAQIDEIILAAKQTVLAEKIQQISDDKREGK